MTRNPHQTTGLHLLDLHEHGYRTLAHPGVKPLHVSRFGGYPREPENSLFCGSRENQSHKKRTRISTDLRPAGQGSGPGSFGVASAVGRGPMGKTTASTPAPSFRIPGVT